MEIAAPDLDRLIGRLSVHFVYRGLVDFWQQQKGLYAFHTDKELYQLA